MSFYSRYNPLFFSFMICMLACLCQKTLAESGKTQIIVPAWDNGRNSPNDYFYRVLTLALTKTEDSYGPAEVIPYKSALTATRVMADLKHNKTVHVMWHSNSDLYARELRAIPISLTKELNEYRVFLIRREDQARFNTVEKLTDLARFTAGSGADWSSREVMQESGLPVIGVTNTGLLFNMLKAKRFDYISRSLFEIWNESEAFTKDGLAMEKTLLVHGGEPFYFFVNKNNSALAKRIEEGLRSAMEDGSLDAIFYSDEGMKRGQEELERNDRLLLKLKRHAQVPNGLP
jgi:hypothetical protein